MDTRTIAQCGDIVHYGGSGFSWTGVIAGTSQSYLMLMDIEGKLCRVPRADETLSQPLIGAQVELITRQTQELLSRNAVRDAIRLSLQADVDPAGWDIWKLPLRDLTIPGRPLTPMAQAYYAWGAYARRKFEEALRIMQDDEDAHAQYHAYWYTVLGSLGDVELAEQRNVSEAAIRMARMRSKRFMAKYLGERMLDV